MSDVKLLAFGAAALALVVFSGAAYEPLNGWFLQRLLGYWWPLDVAGAPLRALQRCKVDRALELQATVTDPQRSDAIKKTLHYLPAPQHVTATAFGCALVAADRRIYAKYGLSSDVCWTPLSYVAPDAARKAVGDARAAIEASGRLIFWTSASLVWLAFAPRWPLRAAVAAGVAVVAAFSYLRLVQQGREYADAFEAAFDIGRASLYKALRVPLPPSNAVEPEYGKVVTSLLYRGLPASGISYVE